MLDRLLATGSLVETTGRKISWVGWLILLAAVIGYGFGAVFGI